jgi:hypothetical protein
MGRNKIKIEKIRNDSVRKVTSYKRTKGLLKKSMELSILCGTRVVLGVYDPNDKLTFYSSDGNTLSLFQNLMKNKNVEKEVISDADVNVLNLV